MLSLAQSQVNTPRHLLFGAIDVNGNLYDPTDTLEFRIVDPAGVNVFPVLAGTYHDIKSIAGAKVSKGIYFAYDTTDGWQVPAAQAEGLYRIDWRYNVSGGTSVLSYSRKFAIVGAALGLDYWTYVSAYDIRTIEGVPVTELSDSRMMNLIERAQQYIEEITGQVFRPVSRTFRVDGDGSKAIRLSTPVIGIDNVKANHSAQSLSEASYRVYTISMFSDEPSIPGRDWRKDPKISFRPEFQSSPFNIGGIFGSSFSARKFNPSTLGHEISGLFGFLEPTGTTPRLITQAGTMLVLNNAPAISVGAAGGSSAGGITRERTDRHEVEYAGVPILSSSLATTTEVEDILMLYKSARGIRLAAPATSWGG